MGLFDDLSASLARNAQRNAFFIRDRAYTYAELTTLTDQIRGAIAAHVPPNEKVVGLATNDDLATYASILALWAEGKAYVPVSHLSPKDRNEYILERAGARVLLASEPSELKPVGGVVRTDLLTNVGRSGPWVTCIPEDLVYILFTSGTTGLPKGVPITCGNLAAFMGAYWELGIDVGPGDRSLQMYELTFDPSVMTYMAALLRGACLYTVPKDEIKFSYIAQLLEDHQLTIASLVPSIIRFLRPYFDEINCPSLRHCLFCGEGLPLDVLVEWSRRMPNARIVNAYGPTEHTIVCTEYVLRGDGSDKAVNGILAIGKAMKGSILVVKDVQGALHERNGEGELCLAGPQLTKGYWNDSEKDAAAFFEAEHKGVHHRFYRTGDLCRVDAEGDFLYLGRRDHQVKIRGFRVELAEVEHHVGALLGRLNAVALAVPDAFGNLELALVVESPPMDLAPVLADLAKRVPQYMVPSLVRCIERIPVNPSGKTDKRALEHLLHHDTVHPAPGVSR